MALKISGADEFGRVMLTALVRAMRNEADQLPDLMTALVLENMHGARNPGGLNRTDKLYNATGALERALVKDGPGNKTTVTVTPEGIAFSFGIDDEKIPYALIHEFGGTITITDKMRRFFWYKYAETGDDKWRWMALTKKTQITMPARPYFEPAIKELDGVELREIGEAIIEEIARTIN